MKFLFLLLSVFIFSSIHAQKEIKLDDAQNHLGDSVKVCGRIYGGRFHTNVPGKPTYLYMGAAYPSPKLTLVIWGKDRRNIDVVAEKDYKDLTICVRGKIISENGKLQLVIYTQEQIEVSEED